MTLDHVRWIGGPPDAGKSTVASLVGERYGATVYRQDPLEREHIRRADPARHPLHVALGRRLEEARDEAAFVEAAWLGRTVGELAAESRAIWSERISLIVADLQDLPAGRLVIAEGPGFFPDVIGPLLADRSHAIWLVPTEGFKRGAHRRRGKSAWRAQTSDPDRALRNHVERDLRRARIYRDELAAADLPWIEVDGSQDAAAVADRVAEHFGLAS